MENVQYHSENDNKVCKICQASLDDSDEQLSFVHPCKCKGSIKYIHEECLKEWISLSKKKKCEICGYTFQFRKTFKPNTPQDIPPTYVILFFLKKIFDVFVNFFCSVLSLSKIFGVFLFNFYICKFYLFSSSSLRISVIQTLLIMIVSLLQSIYIKKTINILSIIRARIANNEVLENLLSEVSSRHESVSSQYTTTSENNSDSNEIDEQTIVNTFDSNDFLLSSTILFRRPTLNNLKQDLLLSLYLSHLAIISSIIIYCSKIINNLLSPALIILYSNSSAPFFYFYRETELSSFYYVALTICLIIVSLLLILRTIKSRTGTGFFRTTYYTLKSYSIIILSSIISSVSVGLLIHFTFSYRLNKSIPIFRIKDRPEISILAHLFLGAYLTYLIRETSFRLSKKFRPGFIISPPKNSSYTSLIESSLKLGLKDFLVKSLVNFTYLCLIPFIIFFFSLSKFDITFGFNPTVVSFIHIKTILILVSNATNITKFFSQIISIMTKLLSKVFNSENYIYNVKTSIPDKSRLVWDLNIPFSNYQHLEFLNKINETIKFDENRKSDLKRNTSFNSENAAAVTKSKQSNIIENSNLDNYNLENENIHLEDDSVTRLRRNSVPNLDQTYANYISSFDTSFTNDGIPKKTKSLIQNAQKNELFKILKKYEINDRRIAKYYGVKHTRKFSIFYKPKNFFLIKLFCLLINLGLIYSLFNLIFTVSYFLCQKINFKTEEYRTIFFVNFSALILTSLSKFVVIIAKKKIFNFRSFLNPFILNIYTNVIFPVIASTTYVLIFATDEFKAFSKCFIVLYSLSGIFSSFFRALFVVSSIDHYSPIYIAKQISLFFSLKIIMISMHLTYNKILVLTSMYPFLLLASIVSFYIYRGIRMAFVGSLMETIKDYFFLDRTEVMNYEDNDE